MGQPQLPSHQTFVEGASVFCAERFHHAKHVGDPALRTPVLWQRQVPQRRHQVGPQAICEIDLLVLQPNPLLELRVVELVAVGQPQQK